MRWPTLGFRDDRRVFNQTFLVNLSCLHSKIFGILKDRFLRKNGAASENEAVLGFRFFIFVIGFHLTVRIFERFNETEQSTFNNPGSDNDFVFVFVIFSIQCAVFYLGERKRGNILVAYSAPVFYLLLLITRIVDAVF